MKIKKIVVQKKSLIHMIINNNSNLNHNYNYHKSESNNFSTKCMDSESKNNFQITSFKK